MASSSFLRCILVALLVTVEAAPSKPYDVLSAPYKRQSGPSLTVDLGYETYEGFFNSTTNINNWLGFVRHAASRTSSLTLLECDMLKLQLDH